MIDTRDLVRRIDELAEKALPQPWAIDPDDRPGMHWNNQIVQASDPNMAVCFMTHDNTPENEEGQANAEFIVALVNAWPAIKAALESAERDARRYRWLRQNANRLSAGPLDKVSWEWAAEEYGVDDLTLDAAIDAALAPGDERGEG